MHFRLKQKVRDVVFIYEKRLHHVAKALITESGLSARRLMYERKTHKEFYKSTNRNAL